jgi:hypothetical protein
MFPEMKHEQVAAVAEALAAVLRTREGVPAYARR